MHDELNIGQKQNNMNMNLQAYQTNEQMMLNCFMNIFYTENKSIISDIFYGMTHTLTKCSNCPFYKHNFEAYFFLIFPLEEVRKYKIEELNNRNRLLNQNMMMINQNMNNFNMDQNMMMNYNQMQIEYNNNIAKLPLLQNNLLTIEDCFDYNQKIENFVGENAMYCDICKMQLPSTFQTKLYNAPEVLILILNRGQGIQFKIKLEFYFQINLFKYLENNNSGYIYDLIGVVTHMGNDGSSGHFIASCRSPVNNNWYQYNDDFVTPITDFNKQVLNYAMPYILFYKKSH
jgi:ubiquitin C-terminal hydrolase